MFQLEFYETEDGKTPVSDFLDSLDDKMAAKMIGLMDVLEEKGTELRKPYSVVKKTQKTPPNEIKIAKKRRDDWIRRHENNNN